jgi:hypothetical protein
MFDEVTGQLKSNSSPVFVTLGAALYLVKVLAFRMATTLESRGYLLKDPEGRT